MYTQNGFKIPDFFIIGAAKSGSTSLWYFLGQHSDIFMTDDIAYKELGYFCFNYGCNDLQTYSTYFNSANKGQLVGEACHAYISSPESAELIWKLNPNAKIIAILRNPIERAFSLYSWMVENGYEYLSFNKAIKREKKILSNSEIVNKKFMHSYFRNYLYLNSGLYYNQIKNYYRLFESKNIFISTSEDLKNNTEETLQEILKFLGVENVNFKFERTNQNVSEHGYIPILNFFNKNYVPYFLQKIRISKNRIHMIQNVFNKYVKTGELKKLDTNAKSELITYYRDDILKTSQLIKKDLSNWLI